MMRAPILGPLNEYQTDHKNEWIIKMMNGFKSLWVPVCNKLDSVRSSRRLTGWWYRYHISRVTSVYSLLSCCWVRDGWSIARYRSRRCQSRRGSGERRPSPVSGRRCARRASPRRGSCPRLGRSIEQESYLAGRRFCGRNRSGRNRRRSAGARCWRQIAGTSDCRRRRPHARSQGSTSESFRSCKDKL